MGYRRGFKAEANWYARELRRELHLEPHEPLCQWQLAEHLGYKIAKLSSYLDLQPDATSYLMSEIGQKEFSAVTIFNNSYYLIIHNDAHHIRRQSANIAHELAHGILMHDPAPLTQANGARSFNKEQEDEANWLGPALLISEEAAILIARRDMPVELTCNEYRVSQDLLQMRLQVTGALIRAARRRRMLTSV